MPSKSSRFKPTCPRSTAPLPERISTCPLSPAATTITAAPTSSCGTPSWTHGGPITVPRLYNGKNRTFFFFNYEGFQQRRAATQVVTIPNAAWKAGDLSRNLNGVDPLPQTFDPYTERVTGTNAQGQPVYTRAPFPNNQIPLSRAPAYVKAYLDLWFPSSLLPSAPLNTGNYINSTGARREDNQTHARIDQKFSDNNNFFGRVSWSDWDIFARI